MHILMGTSAPEGAFPMPHLKVSTAASPGDVPAASLACHIGIHMKKM